MKYLSDYMEAKQTALFKKTGTFFAFNKEQYEQRKKDNITYVNLGQGMLTEKANVKEVINGLNKIYKDSIKQDIKENGKDSIILRELYNHEAFYVGSIEDTIHKLEDYPFTKNDILKVYQKNYEEATKHW
tara:strand:+ start:42 stop:431 length:390 start_codon:yes stop_codon:yes gene_type:complete